VAHVDKDETAQIEKANCQANPERLFDQKNPEKRMRLFLSV